MYRVFIFGERLHASDLSICEADFDTSRVITSGEYVGNLASSEFSTALICFQNNVHPCAGLQLGHLGHSHCSKRTLDGYHIWWGSVVSLPSQSVSFGLQLSPRAS